MPFLKTSTLVTIERHIAEEAAFHPEATGEFSRLLRDFTLALRILARDVRRAGLNDVLGMTDGMNVHGERVKRLDIHANEVIYRAMDHGGHLCVMASEESDGLMSIPDDYRKGKYVLVFDPLDGSSNIDVNVSIGTIFSIYKRLDETATTPGTLADVLQPGYKQVAAGYAMYGSSTQLVYTSGNGVDVFTFDPTIGEFLLTFEKIRIPKRGRIYSVNSGNAHKWPQGVRDYVSNLLRPSEDGLRPYSLRYVGTMVADIHRTLHYGGIFMYPSDSSSPTGKLRLVYEVNPMAFIVEQAGGRATDGRQRVLDIQPDSLHQRVPCFIGSEDDVRDAEAALVAAGDF
ncbi:MAG TPA: class 1 fructose-bisphosphatase [Bacteroidetes bacterium]|nr:class 1 fructose-bisphosphatase [Bacteroidota bacterium]HRK04370.1 class 1 fructose-bisphosphatase [Chlorobiota bacterium]